jgi:hypothetical protein
MSEQEGEAFLSAKVALQWNQPLLRCGGVDPNGNRRGRCRLTFPEQRTTVMICCCCPFGKIRNTRRDFAPGCYKLRFEFTWGRARSLLAVALAVACLASPIPVFSTTLENNEVSSNKEQATAADSRESMDTPNGNALVSDDFLNACTYGKVDEVQHLLQQYPQWVNGQSSQGESCLHVTGIYGTNPEIISVLLAAGADPNTRSTFRHGLRMTPLAWYVYGGHLALVETLLEKGIPVGLNVNMDYDTLSPPPPSAEESSTATRPKLLKHPRKITALDTVSELLEGILRDEAEDNGTNDDRKSDSSRDAFAQKYRDIYQLLVSNGAMRYEEVRRRRNRSATTDNDQEL